MKRNDLIKEIGQELAHRAARCEEARLEILGTMERMHSQKLSPTFEQFTTGVQARMAQEAQRGNEKLVKVLEVVLASAHRVGSDAWEAHRAHHNENLLQQGAFHGSSLPVSELSCAEIISLIPER